ncbi:MAG TPA: IPT/TIG domain-containing protein, partial [Solirubrobacteraceae bacterium]|nr:IPT/TIG domain-containing protein [Solirubrobacteraceae bacterium]
TGNTAGKAKVIVTLPDGVQSTGTTEFTYVAPPTVTSISPTEGSSEGETVVKIKGTGFIKGSTVKIGVSVAAFVVVSATEIIAETAAETAGKYPVVVADKFGTADGPVEYTYVTPALDAGAMGDAGSNAVTLGSVASPPAHVATSKRNAIRLTATVSDGVAHVHVTPTGSRTGRVRVQLRLVRGQQSLAVLTHTVTIVGTKSLTFTMKLPSAASRLANKLQASAAYVGSPGVGSPTVTVALAHTTHKSR